MKFINYLKTIDGVSIYPMISLLGFFVFFSLLVIYVIRTDKKRLEEIKNIPFEK